MQYVTPSCPECPNLKERFHFSALRLRLSTNQNCGAEVGEQAFYIHPLQKMHPTRQPSPLLIEKEADADNSLKNMGLALNFL
jgi:hypothetical protein